MVSFWNAYRDFWVTSPANAKFQSVSRKNYLLVCLLNSFLITLPKYDLLTISPRLFLAFMFFEFMILALFMPLIAGVVSIIAVFSIISLIVGLLAVIGLMGHGVAPASAVSLVTAPTVITHTLLVLLLIYVYWKHLQFFNNRALTVSGGRGAGWFPMVKINFFVGISLCSIPILFWGLSGITRFTIAQLNPLATDASQLHVLWNSFSSSPEMWLLGFYLAGVLLVSVPLGLKNLLSPTDSPTHHDYY